MNRKSQKIGRFGLGIRVIKHSTMIVMPQSFHTTAIPPLHLAREITHLCQRFNKHLTQSFYGVIGNVTEEYIMPGFTAGDYH